MSEDTVTEKETEQPEQLDTGDPDAPPPAPPTGWDPYAPPPGGPAPAGWDPYAPPPGGPAPTGWDPYAPPPGGPAPTGWDPYAPPPGGPAPAGWDPYTPPPNGDPRPQPVQPQPAPVRDGAGRGGAAGAGSAGGGWVHRRLITHLWSYNAAPGVWVGVQGVGWKRLSPASETGHSHLTMLALLARNNRLPVTYHEDAHGQIDQLIV
ncbi:hypothetical protein B0I33_111146 [Prauserella shujinwangii]|uniref:Uncharacterized protein n=1 Tax=Prauserella shujinwangii TaxID=1453103 RepID=A0A2T0LN67_9PSEU|nr:hypothetical protein [Prauserella shujinwangii]PRX44634.1 hypothetical protein B0I33_111146 [Prauserella shujinwangii]